MKILQINTTVNWNSTGKIANEIGKLAIKNGWESWIAYNRGIPQSPSNLIKIGNDWDMQLHGLQTRLFDNHGLASIGTTKKFIKDIERIEPDIIHLHNIHGYYLNYPLLFDYFKRWGGPIVWTFHDCWPYTGHCAYYDFAGCERWQTGCHNCPQLRSYPSSLMADRSRLNYVDKYNAFTGCQNMRLVAVSDWLNYELNTSFFKGYPISTIHNGIDLSIFKPTHTSNKNENTKLILGVASIWEARKGLEEFYELRNLLPYNYAIVLVGLSKSQIASLPDGITGIRRTENIDQLVKLYSEADVFANPTLEDNYPTTNLEALACGTPVVTYNTGGSPEAVTHDTGIIVKKRDVKGLADAIMKITTDHHNYYPAQCRDRALNNFDQNICFQKYIDLYQSLI